ncbi:uncharacterized protein LOC100121150 isoform X1 [Nasonia vitripennis]|uniref:Uncharacterized protein n=1 Tax=Nasonia vitripennis TaxID=7425 RepID=A0A7M7QR86_NASVI|nr:uncharacterized protein LOC100121150 isoform X1 [Nasonia vitripennis]
MLVLRASGTFIRQGIWPDSKGFAVLPAQQSLRDSFLHDGGFAQSVQQLLEHRAHADRVNYLEPLLDLPVAHPLPAGGRLHRVREHVRAQRPDNDPVVEEDPRDQPSLLEEEENQVNCGNDNELDEKILFKETQKQTNASLGRPQVSLAFSRVSFSD